MSSTSQSDAVTAMTLPGFLIGGAVPAICLGLGTSNALIAVLVGAVAFSEWRNLNLSLVALGTLLICAGTTVISLSR
jgi:hypothetical protein